MVSNVTELATTAQGQFFEALESVQDAVLEGVKLWSGAVSAVVPSQLAKSVPLPKVEWLPTPAAAVGLTLDFAEKLFAQQRHFAEQILAETTGEGAPATAVPTSPLVNVATTKTAGAK